MTLQYRYRVLTAVLQCTCIHIDICIRIPVSVFSLHINMMVDWFWTFFLHFSSSIHNPLVPVQFLQCIIMIYLFVSKYDGGLVLISSTNASL